MATMTPQFQEEFYLAALEELARNIDVFNANSNGSLIIGSEDYFGDYLRQAGYDRVSNFVTRRNVQVDTAVTDLRMSLNELVGVDYAHKIGPVFETDENFKRRGRSVAEMGEILGQQFASDFMATNLDLLTSAIVSATDGQAALKNTARNTSTTDYKHLTKAKSLFGDQYSNVRAFLMNSESFFDLVDDGLDNYVIENVAGAQIVNGVTRGALGSPIIVADIPSLRFDAGSSDFKNRVLALTENAGSSIERSGREIVMDRITGQENLGWRYQGETNTRLQVKGYAWDIANGGANPTAAAVATSSNWDRVYDPKLCAASIVETEAA